MDKYTEALESLSLDIWAYDIDSSEVWNDIDLDGQDWDSGVTKVVVVLDDCVVKTAFSGYVIELDENGDYLDDPEFVRYGTDACKVEWEVYKRALEEGVEDFFAKTEYTGYEGVYKQEKCDITFEDLRGESCDVAEDYGIDSDLMQEAIESYECNSMQNLCVQLGLEELGKRTKHSLATAFLVVFYDIKDLMRLQRFLIDYDINDIHASNAGFFNGTAKIFDFSGFESSTSSLI